MSLLGPVLVFLQDCACCGTSVDQVYKRVYSVVSMYLMKRILFAPQYHDGDGGATGLGVALLGFGVAITPVAQTATAYTNGPHIATSRALATVVQSGSGAMCAHVAVERVTFGRPTPHHPRRPTVVMPTPIVGCSAQALMIDSAGGHSNWYPIDGWHAKPADESWGIAGVGDPQYAMFIAPPGVLSQPINAPGVALLQQLCGPAAIPAAGRPAVYARTNPHANTRSTWVATANGHTTVPIPAGQQYDRRFLVEFHGVSANHQAQTVGKVCCSAILFSEEEMEAIIDQPSRFRGGYVVMPGTDTLAGRAVAYKATVGSVAVERSSTTTSGASVARSRVGHRDAGPLLLAPVRGGQPSPFPFVPHRLPLPPETSPVVITTGIAFPLVLTATGTLLAPTSGPALQPPPKRIIEAGYKKLLAVLVPGNNHPPWVRQSLLTGQASQGLAAATAALVAVAPALCAWATGNQEHLRKCDVQDVWDIALATTRFDQDVCQAFRALGTVLSFQANPHPAPGATTVAVMRPISNIDSKVEGAIVIASPLDGHRSTQNKAIILVCTHDDWRLHFYDPLQAADVAYPIGTMEECHPLAVRSSLSQSIAASLGTPIPAIVAVWPLDLFKHPAKLSDPWSVANTSDTSSYAYFVASLANHSIAVMRVACNNRSHPATPAGRLTRIAGQDSPNPAWKGIEVLQIVGSPD